MRIVHLSDTHGCHEGEVELWLKTIKADVIVHSGDFSNRGTWGEAKLFFRWFKNLDFKHKILVPGNHDRFMVRLEKDPHERNKVVPEEITLLIDEAVEVDGVKFYGSPYTPAFNNWAFQLYPHNVEEHWNKIPEDTDVLITHGPSYGVLDETGDPESPGKLGCRHLSKRLEHLNIQAHLFGHIHGGYGRHENGRYLSLNSAALDEDYLVRSRPQIFEIN